MYGKIPDTELMICDRWLFSKQTVNTILKDFKRRALIEFSHLKSDRRNKLIHLTPEGEALAAAIIPVLLELHVMKRMGAAGCAGLIDGMTCLVAYFREGLPEKR